MKTTHCIVTLALVTALLLAAAASAQTQLVPVGGEIQVNTITSGTQSEPDVAMDAQGRFVVTWTHSPTFFEGEIAGQLFDANGMALGGELQINTFTSDRQSDPRVAMAADGSFVVVWTSFQQFPPAIASVIGRRYDANGNPLGGEFEISVGHTAAVPDVAMAADGSFMVLWQGRTAGASGLNDVYVRLYDAAGMPQTAALQVNTASDFGYLYALTSTPDGGWLVAWNSIGDVMARRLDAGGAPLGPETQIGSDANDVALAAGGDRIVAAWMPGSFSIGGPPIRLYDGSFMPITGLLQSSTAPALPTQDVALAMDDSGGFVIAWTEKYLEDDNGDILFPTRDGSESTILARAFNAWGSPLGNDFVVNTTTESFQALPSVAMNAAGRFVVAWTGPPADFFNDVYAQVYVPNDLPVAQCQDQTVSAGPSCDADASIDGGSFDPDSGDTVTLAQSPAGPYSLGATSVTLIAIDDHGASATCTATVTVVDTTAPAIGCPADFTTDASVAAGGAFVPFAISATDACDAAPSIVATPASGSFFSFGTTTVDATATDASGNSTPCSFTITVLTPVEQIDAVSGEIDALVAAGSLTQNKANSLITKLEQAAAKVDSGQLGPACNKLGAFNNQVDAYVNSGTLTAAEGQSLIDAVNDIRTNLGC